MTITMMEEIIMMMMDKTRMKMITLKTKIKQMGDQMEAKTINQRIKLIPILMTNRLTIKVISHSSKLKLKKLVMEA